MKTEPAKHDCPYCWAGEIETVKPEEEYRYACGTRALAGVLDLDLSEECYEGLG